MDAVAAIQELMARKQKLTRELEQVEKQLEAIRVALGVVPTAPFRKARESAPTAGRQSKTRADIRQVLVNSPRALTASEVRDKVGTTTVPVVLSAMYGDHTEAIMRRRLSGQRTFVYASRAEQFDGVACDNDEQDGDDLEGERTSQSSSSTTVEAVGKDESTPSIATS